MEKIINEIVETTIKDISYQGSEVQLLLNNGQVLTFTGASVNSNSVLYVEYKNHHITLED